MRFDIISLFPKALDGYYGASILGRAQKNRRITIVNHDLRAWSNDKHRRVDDTPYGGGPGMVIRIDVIYRALKALCPRPRSDTRVILLTPRGTTFTQKTAQKLVRYKRIILIAGRYEAIDARIDRFVDEKLSLGHFVLTGGELAAACIVDAVSRLVPGVLGKAESLATESFQRFSKSTTLIEHPQYTKPEVFRSLRVPKILLSGHHQRIAAWRRAHSKKRIL